MTDELVDDIGFAGRERVLERVVHEAGNVEDIRRGLEALAEPELGDCTHRMGDGSPDRCVRCIARRFLRVLDENP